MHNIKRWIKFKSIREKIKSMPYSFITWISYFTTLLVSSLVIIALLNANYERTTMNIISSLNEELTKYSQKTSLQVQEMIKNYSFHTFYTPAVANLRESTDLSNFEVISGIRALNTLVSTNKYVHSVYVYNSENNYVYSTLEFGSNTLENFIDRGSAKIFEDGVQENIGQPLYREMILKNMDKIEGVYSFLLYSSSNGIDYDNAMLVNLYSDEYDNSFFEDNYNEELIIDKKHEKIIVHSKVDNTFSYDEEISFINKILHADKDHGYFIEGTGKDKTIYLYSYMNEHQRYFVRYMKYNDFIENMRVIKDLSTWIILIIIASGAVISFIMLTRIYMPLKKIIHTISKHNNDSTYGNSESILKNLDFWVQNRQENQQAYLSVVKQEFLKQLLKSNSMPVHSIEQNFAKYEISLNTKLPIVILLTKGLSMNDAMDKVKSSASVEVEGVGIDTFSVLFIQCAHPVNMESLCQEMIKSGATFCSYSLPIQDYSKLSSSYNRVREVYAFRVFYPDASYLNESILDEKSKESTYPNEEEEKIVLSLKNGKLKSAIGSYHSWLETMKNYRYNVITFDLKKLYLTISALYRQMNTTGGNTTDTDGMEYIEDRLNEIEVKLNEIEDIHELSAIFFPLFEKICDLTNKKKNSKSNQIVEEIKSIIKEDYADPNLSSQTLADKFELSNAYVGKMFRSKENCSISNFINNVRIEHAKVMLLCSDITVNDIAVSVGFDNTSYFYTLFKNHTGMSPAAYRESGGQADA